MPSGLTDCPSCQNGRTAGKICRPCGGSAQAKAPAPKAAPASKPGAKSKSKPAKG